MRPLSPQSEASFSAAIARRQSSDFLTKERGLSLVRVVTPTDMLLLICLKIHPPFRGVLRARRLQYTAVGEQHMHALKFWTALTAAVLTTQSATAQLFYCDRPRKPSCIDTMATSRDEDTFQACRYEVERYQKRSTDYQDCLRTEFEDMASERKKIIDRFNSCAQSSYC